jgi:hypothetical protein
MLQTYLKNQLSSGLSFFLAGIFVFMGLKAAAQDVNSVDEKGILYNRVKHIGLTIHSSGLGVN